MISKSSKAPYLSIAHRPGAIPELDGLRGIAILLVLLRHGVQPIIEQHGRLAMIGSWDLAAPLLNGWMGVDLFFVLSGFLITHHLLKRWPSKWSLGFALKYWSKRILRTFPAYYAAVLIAFSGLVPLFEPAVSDARYSLTVHFLFLQDYLGSDLVAAFWSLGVEEKFYVLCPFVLVLLRRIPSRWREPTLVVLIFLPLVLRITTAISAEHELLNYAAFFWVVRSPFHVAMDGLWIGVTCALLFNERLGARRHYDRAASLLFTASVTAILLLMLPVAWFDEQLFIASAVILNLVSIAFGGLLLSVCIGRTPASGLLRSRWLRVVSVLSYSIYLVHLMFVPLALEIAEWLPGYSTAGALAQFAMFLPLFLALSAAGGLLLHLSVEKPFLILKDNIRI